MFLIETHLLIWWFVLSLVVYLQVSRFPLRVYLVQQ